MNRRQENELTALLRQKMLERDNHTCQNKAVKNYTPFPTDYLGCEGRLVMAHIYTKTRYKKLKWELDNVLTMCNDHHDLWWHKYPKLARYWFEIHFPERFRRLRARIMMIEKMHYDMEFYKETKRRLTE